MDSWQEEQKKTTVLRVYSGIQEMTNRKTMTATPLAALV